MKSFEDSLHIFYNTNFFIRQFVKLIHQSVDLGVGGIDLPLETGPVIIRPGCWQLLVKR